MLLAVPLMMLLKVVLENSYEFRWLSIDIGKDQRYDAAQEEQEIREAVVEAVDAGEEPRLPKGAATESGSSS